MKIVQNYLKNDLLKNLDNGFNLGDNLKGIIKDIDKDNKVCINLNNNYTLKFDRSEIVGNVGDSVEFIVLKSDNKNIILKQEISNNTKIIDSEDFLVKKDLKHRDTSLKNLNINHINTLEKVEKNTYESSILIKKTKENIEHLSNTVGEMALNSLTNLGLNPNKINIERISEIVKKTVGQDTSENLKEDDEEIKVDIDKLGITKEQYYKYAKLLDRFNLPITFQNIVSLQNVENKIGEIKDLGEGSILNLLKNGSDITFQDLYVSKYTNLNVKNNVELEQFESLENLEILIKDLFEKQDILFNKENLEIAKKFIYNEIDVSKENLEKFKLLLDLKNNISEEYILENAVLNIIKNKNPLNLSVLKNKSEIIENKLVKEYSEIKNIIPNIDTNYIEFLLRKNIPINLKNIVNNFKLTGSLEEDKKLEVNYSKKTRFNSISEKIKLAKIQMKLTNEAIFRLSKSNINISTKPLEEVINQLEKIESEVYRDNFKVIGVENPTESQIEQVKNNILSIQNISSINSYFTFNKIINKEIEFSIESINTEILANSNSEKIIKTFEMFETKPIASFGDKINNLDLEFINLLKNNNLEVNNANLKAAKILTLNNIDFNEEDLTRVKIIDNKIQYIYNNLHPLTIANMIKKGINPVNQNIDDLIKLMDKFSEDYFLTSKDKIAECIFELDKQNNLSAEERDAIISIYRMLNLIEKNGSASIGNLLKTKGGITLSNLLEASNIYRKNKKNIKFDKKIDASFGELEELKFNKNNILNSIQKSLSSLDYEYNDILIKQMFNVAKPNKISKILNSLDSNEILIEDFLEKITNYEDKEEIKNLILSNKNVESILHKIKDSNEVSLETLKWLVKNSVTATLVNIENAEKLIKDKFDLSKNIEKLNNTLKQSKITPISLIADDLKTIEDKKDFEKNLNNVKFQLDNKFEDIINLENISDITSILLKNNLINEQISFNKLINELDNGIVQVPIQLSNGKTTNLNMYILNSKSIRDNERLNIFLSLETKNFGYVQSYISLKNKELNLQLSSNSIENTEKLKSYFYLFENSLKLEFEKLSINFSCEEKSNIYSENFKEQALNKMKTLNNDFDEVI